METAAYFTWETFVAGPTFADFSGSRRELRGLWWLVEVLGQVLRWILTPSQATGNAAAPQQVGIRVRRVQVELVELSRARLLQARHFRHDEHFHQPIDAELVPLKSQIDVYLKPIKLVAQKRESFHKVKYLSIQRLHSNLK